MQSVAASLGRHTRKPKQPELLLLMYHRVLPLDDPRAQQEEPGMIVSPETFRLHMSLIKQSFETIHLSRWLELKNSNKSLPLRACAITFDDGWADNYEFAYPILQELEIPATIFLVSDMVGKNDSFWPQRLSHLLTDIAQHYSEKPNNSSLDWIAMLPCSYTFSKIEPDQEQLSEIIAAAKSFSDIEIHRRLDLIEEDLGIPAKQNKPSILNWEQVNEMCDSGLIEAGSHTCNHIRLTGDREEDQLQQEIISSKEKIETRTGREVKTFCYPNGDYSAQALSLVENNYLGAVTTENGWNTSASNSYLLHRIGVHEDITYDKTGFLARISGWL
jgi:peptidoglycan/xylan/chitin deacetylase (PgdA/CDA1 family)